MELTYNPELYFNEVTDDLVWLWRKQYSLLWRTFSRLIGRAVSLDCRKCFWHSVASLSIVQYYDLKFQCCPSYFPQITFNFRLDVQCSNNWLSTVEYGANLIIDWWPCMQAGIKTQIHLLEQISMFTSHPKQEETNNLGWTTNKWSAGQSAMESHQCSYKLLNFVSVKEIFFLMWNYHFNLTQSLFSIPNFYFKPPKL